MVDDVLSRTQSWVSTRRDTGVVVSSRIRIARNVAGAAFPGWSGKQECIQLYEHLVRILSGLPGLTRAMSLSMSELDPVEREVLRERRLISFELAGKGEGSGLVLSEPERVAVMINEEDHLRIQAVRPGFDLGTVWAAVREVDLALEKHVTFAFSPTFGYLTACPSNVGTGLRASVLVHLPGLRLMNEIDPAVKGLNRMGLAVRGAFGEGTEAFGNMYQISNQVTLGQKESSMISRLEDIIQFLVRQERQARQRLLEQRRIHVLDHCARAYAILKHARILSSGEAMDVLSGLRLGVEFGMIKNVSLGRLNEVMLLAQPGHLQKVTQRRLDPHARDEVRAELVREKIKRVTLAG